MKKLFVDHSTAHIHGTIDEEELQHEPLIVAVPVRHEATFSLVDGMIRDLEADGLVGLASEEDVLVAAVRRLDLLLVRGHESMARLVATLDLWVVYLKCDRSLSSDQISRLRDLQEEERRGEL